MRVLVADDSPTIQKVIALALQSFDLELLSVSDLAHTQRELEAARCDLLIVDSCLPIGAATGLSLSGLLRRFSYLPTIVLRGSFEASDFKLDGLSASQTQTRTQRMLFKPFDSEALLSEIAELLDLSSQKPQMPFQKPTKVYDGLTGIQMDPSTRKPAPTSSSARAGAVPSKGSLHELLGDVFMEEKLPKLIEKAVWDYCRTHFKGAAQEVLTKEIRRLMDERSIEAQGLD